mmetsp:Transcript_96603/g.273586  ORF Transcript_96603/g.273586 Transcript_96603/m.273586 type:complete len:259 (+) Transcript_96603:77-853(+)
MGLAIGTCDGGARPRSRSPEHVPANRRHGRGGRERGFDFDDSGGDRGLDYETRQHQKQEVMKERAREWQRQLRTEARRIDRDIQRVQQEESRLKTEIKAMAKKGHEPGVRTLAKQVVRSRKSVQMLERTKCSMTAMSLQLSTTMASFSTAGSLKLSATMMKEMNRLANVPEMQEAMAEMRAEMARAEMADDIMQEGMADSDDEAEADTELEKVYDELALDTSKLLGATAPAVSAVPTAARAAASAPPTISQRLEALNN